MDMPAGFHRSMPITKLATALTILSLAPSPCCLQSNKMGGLSRHWSPCWAAIVRLQPPPSTARPHSLSGATAQAPPAAPPPCTQLWLFRDRTSAQLKARLYLNGSTAFRAGGGQDARVVSPGHQRMCQRGVR